MYGLTRGTLTLIGAAVAGFLIWLATWIGFEGQGDYWASMGLLAAAGLTMAVSQLLGGWTKWGWPRISGSVFLLGFIPALIAGGLVVLAGQPDESAWGTGWAAGIGLGWLAEDLAGVLPAIAFAIGLVFGLTFDTTGPGVVVERDEAMERERRRHIGPVPVGRRHRAADEPLTAERQEVATTPTTTTPTEREGELVGTRSDGGSATTEPRETETRPRRFFRRG
jgi:hypothetical protein